MGRSGAVRVCALPGSVRYPDVPQSFIHPRDEGPMAADPGRTHQQGVHRSMTLVVRLGRRSATAFLSAALIVLVATGTVLASTPVTVGYRDHSYGGGAFRPNSDKPQSK